MGSANFGHFYSFIKIEDSWYCFSDKYVKKWCQTNVLNYAKGLTSDKISGAYCLFYTKSMC